MTVVHTAGQTVTAFVRAWAPTWVSIAGASTLGLVVGIAVAWGAADGWLRRDRPATTWLVAALVTGPVAGLLGVIAQAVLVDATGLAAVWPALTGGAAFTALLVLVPAAAGTGAGRLLEPPRRTRRVSSQSQG
jgi:hypothetical protein